MLIGQSTLKQVIKKKQKNKKNELIPLSRALLSKLINRTNNVNTTKATCAYE